MERTLAILKPDTVQAGNAEAVIKMLEAEGLHILASKTLHLDVEQARGFYAIHSDRPFFQNLITFMTEGPVVVMVLEGPGAIQVLRKVMGATDPAKADEGTIRKRFGTNIERNSIHGSDAPETAAFEISYFFSQFGSA